MTLSGTQRPLRLGQRPSQPWPLAVWTCSVALGADGRVRAEDPPDISHNWIRIMHSFFFFFTTACANMALVPYLENQVFQKVVLK